MLADSGHNPIIAVGFAYSGPLAKVAPEFPDVKFAIVDDADAEGENISNLALRRGAGLVPRRRRRRAEVARRTRRLHRRRAGAADHRSSRPASPRAPRPPSPTSRSQTVYLTQPPDFTGFNDPAKGRTAAQGMFDARRRRRLPRRRRLRRRRVRGGQGGRRARHRRRLRPVRDGRARVQDVILTSMLKKVDVAVFDFITSVADGDVEAGPRVFDLEAGGVDYSTSGGQVDDIKTSSTSSSSRSSPARSRSRTRLPELRPTATDGRGPRSALASPRAPSRLRSRSPPSTRRSPSRRRTAAAATDRGRRRRRADGHHQALPRRRRQPRRRPRGAHAARSTPSSARTAPASRR